MKKPLYFLDQYEKQRILEMHKKATNQLYLKEDKEPLNEFFLTLLGIGLAAGGAAALYKNWDSLTGQKSKDAFSQINKGCDIPTSSKLKTFNNPNDYQYIAKKLNKSFNWSDWYTLGMDWGTYNETVTKLLKKIRSIGDYCKVKKEYEKLYTQDLGEVLMDEVYQNFDTIVMNGLSGAVKKTMEVDGDVPGYKKIEDKTKEDEGLRDPGGGNKGSETEKDDDLSYVVCSGEFYKGCKDGISGGQIKKLQGCLGLEQTGKYDDELDKLVQSEIKKSKITTSDISDICGEL